MTEPTRGERNCNPGNIDRNAIQWVGTKREQTDSRFVCFETPTYGIRALAKVLLTYYRKHGLNTVEKIIGRWAPPVENNTEAYDYAVATMLGVGVQDVINLEHPHTLDVLVRAIIRHENGRCIYDDATIDAAILKALA